MPRLSRVVVILFGVLSSLSLAAPARAQQPQNPDKNGTDYFVTIAARTCDRYEDISANKARNNIQESLRDLGPDTKYTSGQLVKPAQEQQMQPNCSPLTGSQFTFGSGISPTKVTGTWGSLSVASGPSPRWRRSLTATTTAPSRSTARPSRAPPPSS